MTCEKVLIINQGRVVAYDQIRKLAKVHGGKAENVSLEEIFIKLTAA
jgi:ABC-2 type transport system ATP-binding protein